MCVVFSLIRIDWENEGISRTDAVRLSGQSSYLRDLATQRQMQLMNLACLNLGARCRTYFDVHVVFLMIFESTTKHHHHLSLFGVTRRHILETHEQAEFTCTDLAPCVRYLLIGHHKEDQDEAMWKT